MGNTGEPKSPPIPSGSGALNLLRYETRLDRQLHRAFRMLYTLQRLESRKPLKRRKKRKK